MKINAIDIDIRKILEIQCYIYVPQLNIELSILEKDMREYLNPKVGK